jgi:hypothetical protein
MKKHREFRRALLVSIQERQAQYPEMADIDLEKALRTIADRSATERYRRRQAERLAEFRAWMAQPKAWRTAARASEWAKRQAVDREAFKAG